MAEAGRQRTLRTVVALATVVVVAVAVLAVGGWLGWFSDPTISDAPEASADVEVVATGLAAPWDLAFLPDGTALVTERDSARLLAVDDQGTTREVTTIADAAPGGEGGLLGVAVSPAFATDRLVYLYYTTVDDNRIVRLRIEPDGAAGTPEPVLTGIPRSSTHNGGRIAFGPDAMLYAGTGDAGERGAAQDPASLAGKILRLAPDGSAAPDNPFPDSPVFSLGHRNVQGLDWGPDGQLFASEFGQNRHDELNRIEAGGNYGWPTAEGVAELAEFIDPVATWAPRDASPSGLAFHQGRFWLACLRGERLYRVAADGTGAETLISGEYGRLRHVATAPDGALWALTSNRDGRGSPAVDDDRILRITG
ncbi:PQQ-dependent sugar dehydrogenase [Micromonospora sp. NBC_01813]|uniref:PQQ-dependent sugar dehydrogenase n=1 Tax=Micromonospora sp. NBC_01813 TaxID=2975988 RepID=UPI002DDA8B71|nr:PQQ-dependent sugar dehydrogenase [Micromonospora sp. NBC_01813]WSA11046.1 PQQ-dependent sugar dehydrogenase [Micromonospora sp. NBC_01813]